MPTYVYECSSCNTQFEIEQRITENALDTCLCGSLGTVKRLIQPIAVVFKGSGFHINDYAASTGTAPKTGSTAEPKSDSQPEAPSDNAGATATPDPAPAAQVPSPSATESKPSSDKA